MHLGVLSHLFRGSPAAVAAACRQHGLTCVQLTPSFPGLRFHEPGDIVPERCREVAAPFREAGIVVAALSGLTQLLEPDLDRRHEGIIRLHALLRCGRDFGTSYLVVESGSLSPQGPGATYAANRSPEAWAELRIIVGEALQVAAASQVMLLLKPGPTHVLATAEDIVRLRKELPDSHFGFVMDPANLLWDSKPAELSANLERLVERIGPWTPLVHAKDLQFGADGVVSLPRVGRGVLDYGWLLQRLREFHADPPVILEHLRPDEVDAARHFMSGVMVRQSGASGMRPADR